MKRLQNVSIYLFCLQFYFARVPVSMPSWVGSHCEPYMPGVICLPHGTRNGTRWDFHLMWQYLNRHGFECSHNARKARSWSGRMVRKTSPTSWYITMRYAPLFCLMRSAFGVICGREAFVVRSSWGTVAAHSGNDRKNVLHILFLVSITKTN